MPCLLKERTGTSPGIVTFTSNEAIYGPAMKSERLPRFLIEGSAAGDWIFGVHVQGDFSHSRWHPPAWQSFAMWPEPDAPFLSDIPESERLPLNCVNFMPDHLLEDEVPEPWWDVVTVTRPSTIKRAAETLAILQSLVAERPTARVAVVAPDSRDQLLGERAYDRQGIDRRFFELPLRIFSAEELRRVSFLCSSPVSFGRFPLDEPLVYRILARSRFLLIASHSEGTPRSIAESLLTGRPCVVSEHLRSGIRGELHERNAIFVPDDPVAAARAIAAGLDEYDRFAVDRERARSVFAASRNLPELRARLTAYLDARGLPANGSWYLDDLHIRLPGHGQKYDAQFMRSDETFFAWLDAVERLGPYDEDAVLGPIGAEGAVTGWRDPPVPLLRRAAARVRKPVDGVRGRFGR
jgi:glycosyltransferase involved in cell wall biosynthesis